MAAWGIPSRSIPRTIEIIREFALQKPAFRIIANSPATHGAVGFSTGLSPAMTLGCGAYGGNITSDNITPMHLINVKRLAYGIRPVDIAKALEEYGYPGERRCAGELCRARRAAARHRVLSKTRIARFLETRGLGSASGSEPGPRLRARRAKSGDAWHRLLRRPGVAPWNSSRNSM